VEWAVQSTRTEHSVQHDDKAQSNLIFSAGCASNWVLLPEADDLFDLN
jgi:hypothetical protein